LEGPGVACRPYNPDMPYVAKATLMESGEATWLTTPRRHGSRTFGPRDLAEMFSTDAEASLAIIAMVAGEDCRGIRFTIEAAD
jgi:hypothetical protein